MAEVDRAARRGIWREGDIVKLAVIAPMKNLELSMLGDIDFAFANTALESSEYASFFYRRAEKRFLIMDNGAYELGRPLEVELLLKAAKLLRANEIVAPDVLFDYDLTVKFSKEFIDSLTSKQRRTYRVMFVPQGKSVTEWLDAHSLSEKLECDTIGLSVKVYTRIAPRKKLFELMSKRKILEYHLLGLDMVEELMLYEGCNVRSVDTSLPISRAFYCKSIFQESKRIDLLGDRLDLFQQDAAVHNIFMLKSFLPGEK